VVTKSGYVAILGRPNVGKSTLLNALLGQKLSIVTAKPQTTRARVVGILTTDTLQAIFLDTPGLLDPKYRLQEAMVKQIETCVKDSDLLLFMVDASDFESSFDEILRESLSRAKKPSIVAVNKIDCADQETLSIINRELGDHQHPDRIVFISALRGDNLDQLKVLIEQNLPIGPFLYPEDVLSIQPERFFTAEMIREEVFEKLRQEIPYSIAVKIDQFEEKEGKDYIRAIIYVEKESQKGIVIGAGGAMLKKIGASSRQKIEAFLDRPVYLDLWVKVRKNWRKKDSALREFGYLE